MTRCQFVALITQRGACDGALDWIASQPRMSVRRLWETCPYGPWLGWLLNAFAPKDVRRRAAVACMRPVVARAVERLAAAGFGWHADRITALAGAVTRAECEALRRVCRDTYATAAAATADAAAAAAYAAADAAAAAAYAAYAADAYAAAAADAADAAADAAYAAADAAAAAAYADADADAAAADAAAADIRAAVPWSDVAACLSRAVRQ